MTGTSMPSVMPVFPLPNVVFFPGTELPLRVFEPRYLQMVEDVQAGDGWMAVTLLKPGYEADYEGAPEMHVIAGVGRLVEVRPRKDGTLYIRLEGVTRVVLREVESDRLYRKVEVAEFGESAEALAGPGVEPRLRELLQLAEGIRTESDDPEPLEVPESTAARGLLVNRLAAAVMVEPEEKQQMLEAADGEARLKLLVSRMRVAANILRALKTFPRPGRPENN